MSDRSVKSRLAFFDRIDRLRADERFSNGHGTPQTRDFIETWWWCRWQTTTHEEAWELISTPGVLRSRYGRRSTEDRLSVHAAITGVYYDDAPRWEPENFGGRGTLGCEHTLHSGPRRGQRCGKSYRRAGRVEHADGTWHVSAWCGAHESIGQTAFAESRRIAATPRPEPTPNRGGLLPVYIRANNWPDLYAAHSPGWKPPAVGINADDWPVMERVLSHVELAQPERPALRLIPGGIA